MYMGDPIAGEHIPVQDDQGPSVIMVDNQKKTPQIVQRLSFFHTIIKRGCDDSKRGGGNVIPN